MGKMYFAKEETSQQILDEVKGISSSGAVGILPHIIVTAPTGCTVTLTDGNATLTADENSGTWEFYPPHLGDWTVATSKNGHTVNKTVKVEGVQTYRVKTSHGLRYGYRINKNESNPSASVEYLFDAEGLNPAHMDYTNGVFDYGDWKDKWFVKGNKPLMLRPNGQVDYYLNPDNYDEKEDGSLSDVANVEYHGNAMAQFPLCWVKRYEDENYKYVIISDVQYDEDYKAYAHTRADGTIADFFYWSMFGGSKDSNGKMRSLSGLALTQSLTAQQEIDACKANGDKWYTHVWSQHELIRDLLVLMGKSTDTQSVFGNGNCRQATQASGMLQTGTLKDKGQFYGYNTSTQQVKVFHIEKFWGDQWDRIAGLVNVNGKIYVKMTPEENGYRVTDAAGYTDTGVSAPAGNGVYISEMKCNEYGMIPTACSGSSTTYYPDGYYANNNQFDYLLVGASAGDASALGGAFCFDVYIAPSSATWNIGCGLSCEQPAAA